MNEWINMSDSDDKQMNKFHHMYGKLQHLSLK